MCEDHEHSIGPLLAYCGQLCKQRMDLALKEYDVTQMQARVLLYLMHAEKEKDVHQRELERQFRIKGSTVNGIVERLEEKGLLTRVYERTDGRCRKLSVTEKGRQLQNNMYQSIEKIEALMIRGFSDEDTEKTKELLRRMIDNLKKGEEAV